MHGVQCGCFLLPMEVCDPSGRRGKSSEAPKPQKSRPKARRLQFNISWQKKKRHDLNFFRSSLGKGVHPLPLPSQNQQGDGLQWGNSISCSSNKRGKKCWPKQNIKLFAKKHPKPQNHREKKKKHLGRLTLELRIPRWSGDGSQS